MSGAVHTVQPVSPVNAVVIAPVTQAEFDPVTLHSLASEPCWVAWRLERSEKRAETKIAYTSISRKAKSDTPPWLTRTAAEALFAKMPNPLGMGGLGIMFYDLDHGRSIAGLDLDDCRNPDTGEIAEWAGDLIDTFNSYAEVSPSGTGVKVFYTFATADWPALRKAMGQREGDKDKYAVTFKRGDGQQKHPPAIEVHLGHRYYTVTEQIVDGMPHEFRHVPTETIIKLITETGPAFAGKAKAKAKATIKAPDKSKSDVEEGEASPDLQARIAAACAGKAWFAERWNGDWTGISDTSRSGQAFTVLAVLKRSGFTKTDAFAALRLNQHTSAWMADKGEANGQREPSRFWDAIEVKEKPGKPQQAGLDTEPSPAWQQFYQLDDKANPIANLANALTALRNADETRDLLAFDEMTRTAIIRRTPPGGRHGLIGKPRAVMDADVSAIQEWLQRQELRRLGKDTTHQAVDLVAMEHAYHPVRNYLSNLTWDGTPRLHSWLAYYLGCEPAEGLSQADADSERLYIAAIGKMFLIAMVARIMQPGCQADYMLILEGKQGDMKSTVCGVLGDEWFSDGLPDIRTSDAVRLSMHLRGKWLIEIAELSAMSKGDVEHVKAFVTQRKEIYTPKFARKEVTEDRQCLFIGTTNKAQYLRDETGARRFWPVKVGTIDIDALRNDRDQLFAEAVVAYRRGDRSWPDRDFETKHIAPQQEARREADAWEQAIAEWLEGKNKVTILGVAREALFIDLPKIGTADQRRISAALEVLGWQRAGMAKGVTQWEPSNER